MVSLASTYNKVHLQTCHHEQHNWSVIWQIWVYAQTEWPALRLNEETPTQPNSVF